MTRRLVALVLVLAAAGPLASAEDDARLFEAEVRPLLIERCVKCHGPEKQKGKLRLDTLAAAREGGATGPAIVPGDPVASLMIEAIRHEGLEMPPDGRLEEAQIELLTRWIEDGAAWTGPGSDLPDASPATRSKEGGFTPDDRAYWAFQPVVVAPIPDVPDPRWANSPIDAFVFDALRREGLTPSPEADRGTLIRRLTFDLTGLPPSPEEIAAFVADAAEDALPRLVDRLLESPRYGERWGRHWLDLVRYAESDGFRADEYRPQAHRYRDYVIASFNGDKPYDRFIREQLAGDEMNPRAPEWRDATQYLRLWIYESNQRDVEGQWANILNDVTDVTADVFLGMGMACARCHDHKYDPIKQVDYFRMQAYFGALLPVDDRPLEWADPIQGVAERQAAWDVSTSAVRSRLDALERPYREAAERDALSKFPPQIKEIMARPASARSPRETQLAYLAFRQVLLEWSKLGNTLKGDAKQERDALVAELATYDAMKPSLGPLVEQVAEVAGLPPTVIPGDRTNSDVPPGVPSLLDPSPATVVAPDPWGATSGRRLALANWIADPSNPMTARVMANRVWQYHFGRGLVETPSDFGRLGVPPSHPELLDWLANEFVSKGWSLKALHRTILLSATYRQASGHPDPGAGRLRDPANRWLWHFPIRRLEAEAIRDAVLVVSGELDPAMSGPGVESQEPRRTVYVKVMRNKRDPLLEAFDGADGYSSAAVRNLTVSPTQALLMINGPWVLDRARALARRLQDEAPVDNSARIERAFQLAFGRSADHAEIAAALAFLARQSGGGVAPALADASACDPETTNFSIDEWADLAHALVNSNEFLYVD